MPRIGISYQEVASVAESLLKSGSNPTIEKIRRKLGTGSSTTISRHLRTWKQQLPSDKQTVYTMQRDQVEKLQQQLHKYQQNNRRWQQLFQSWMEEKKQLESKVATLEEQLASANKDRAFLKVDKTVLQTKLEAKTSHLSQLQDLYRHLQGQYQQQLKEITQQRDQLQTQIQQHSQLKPLQQTYEQVSELLQYMLAMKVS